MSAQDFDPPGERHLLACSKCPGRATHAVVSLFTKTIDPRCGEHPVRVNDRGFVTIGITTVMQGLEE